MEKQKWNDLSPLQIGKYSEYIAKMEFILYGFDVYSPELDDKGIDFIVRKDDSFYFDIQVKAVRDFNYIYFQKSKFQIRENPRSYKFNLILVHGLISCKTVIMYGIEIVMEQQISIK